MLDLLPLAGYAAAMSVTPGPNNVMLTASGVNFGYRRSLPHMLGIGLGCGVQTFLVAVGLGTLFARLPWLHTALQWGGAAYLVYLAIRVARAGEIGRTEGARPLTLIEGAAFQFVNPKAWVMAITTVALFLPAGGPAWTAGLAISAVLMLVNFPCISVWTLFGVALSRLLSDARYRRAFNGAMALLLVATAVLGLLDSPAPGADTALAPSTTRPL
ncbi:LysE family translocator [Crenobacter cavernae]|nr:LysE family translocator [Crenobacter cavernae]